MARPAKIHATGGDTATGRGRALFFGLLVLLLLAVLALGYAWGVISHAKQLFPYNHLKELFAAAPVQSLGLYSGYDVTLGREELACRELPADSLVLVLFGQSNAGNSGAGRFGAVEGVYNYNHLDGRCYRARDPLLGATGNGGTPWLPLAQAIIRHSLSEAVVLAPIAVGQTRVAQWAPGGNLHGRIGRVLDGLRAAGLPVGKLLWHQGESDGATSTREYEEAFLRMAASIRDAGEAAPIHVAVATRCQGEPNPAVRRAQQRLPMLMPGLRAGPDTDGLAGPRWRVGCHFTQEGLRRHADLWFSALYPMETGQR
tara:strand:+ start:52 stop:993 length:942 start_codon:yes stop_codon:yes gene_type:complete